MQAIVLSLWYMKLNIRTMQFQFQLKPVVHVEYMIQYEYNAVSISTYFDYIVQFIYF
jgi:hypothetical protein